MWSHIKKLTDEVNVLRKEVSNLRAFFTVVQECPAANQCPLDHVVERFGKLIGDNS
jgi:hypothetical protein